MPINNYVKVVRDNRVFGLYFFDYFRDQQRDEARRWCERMVEKAKSGVGKEGKPPDVRTSAWIPVPGLGVPHQIGIWHCPKCSKDSEDCLCLEERRQQREENRQHANGKRAAK